MGVDRDDPRRRSPPPHPGDPGFDALPTNIIPAGERARAEAPGVGSSGLGGDAEDALEGAQPEGPDAEPTAVRSYETPTPLAVDSGILPEATPPPEGGASGAFEVDLAVDEGLIDELSAGLPGAADVEPTSQSAATRVRPAAPYWEGIAARLRAEVALLGEGSDRRRAAVLHYELGRICELRLGRSAEALAAYQGAFGFDPTFGPNLRALSRSLTRRGNFTESGRLLDAEIACAPASERAALLVERGRLRERLLEDPEGAARDYESALEVDPQDAAALVALGDLAHRRGDFEHAIALAEHRATGTHDASLRAALHCEAALLAEDRLSDPARATDHYRRALEADPTCRPAVRALIRIYRRQRRYRELVEVYQAAAALAATLPETAGWLHRAARACRDRLADQERGLALLERAAVVAGEAVADASAADASIAAAEPEESFLAPKASECRGSVQTGTGLADPAAAIVESTAPASASLAPPPAAPSASTSAAEMALRAILVDLAGIYEEQKRLPELADTLERAAGLIGDRRQAAALYYRLGRLCAGRMHDEDRAIRALREAVALAPDHHPARRALGKLYSRRERYTDLIGLLADEAEQSSDPERRAARYYRIADLYERKLGDGEHALEWYEKALSALPAYAPALRGLGRVCDSLGRASDQVQVYERELAYTRDRDEQSQLLVRIGQLWEDRLSEPLAAVSSYERLLAIQPNHPHALRSLERLYAQGERWRDLVEILTRQAEQLGDASQVVPLYVRAGEVFEDKLGEPDRALRAYKQALALKPDFLPALVALGRLAPRLGRWDDLVEMYRREIEVSRDPDHITSLYYKTGEVLEQALGRPDDAARAYLEALRLEPHFQPARDALARLHESRGNWHELVVLMSRGREPEDSRARSGLWYRLGEIQERHLGNPGAATESYRRGLRARPDETAAREALERLLRGAGDRQALIALYSQVVAQAEPGAQVDALWKLARLFATEDHDLDRAAEALGNILALEPQNRFARRELARLLARIDRWDALVPVLDAERQGAGDPRWQIACGLEMAAVREFKLGDPRGAAELYYQILSHDPNHPQALAALESFYRQTGNTAGLAQVLGRYAQLAASPAEAACYLLSVGAAHEACGAHDRALRVWHEALERQPGYLAALRALGRVYREQGDLSAQALALEAEARASLALDRKAELEVAAADVWGRLGEGDRALAAYRRALSAEPAHAGALGALDRLYAARGAWRDLAALLEHAAAQTRDTTARRDVRMRLGELARTQLGDPARAMAAYRQAIDDDPRFRPALAALAELCRAAGDWNEVAALDERQLQLVKSDTAAQRALHLELANIWDERVPNARRALDHYQRVLALDPSDQATLDRVSLLLIREREFVGAEQATLALVTQATERSQKIKYLLRLANVYADGLGDTVRAASACRDALALDPNDLEATERLAIVLARLKDWKALGAHLDGVLRMHRARIAEAPWRVQSYQVLRKVFEWQKAYDRVYCAAGVLHVLGAARPEDDAFLRANQAAALAPARAVLADALVEQQLVAPSERGSLREILRVSQEALEKIYPPDPARHQLSRATRISPRGNPRLHALATEVAHTFGVAAFELHVTAGAASPVAVDGGEPPLVILSAAAAHSNRSQELRFLLGYALGRIRAGLVAAFKLRQDELGRFVAALLALEVGSFVPPYPPSAIEPLARRIQKALSKKALRALGPYALELAGDRFQPETWLRSFEATATHAAVLACADIPTAVETALRLDGAWDRPAPPRNPEELGQRIRESPHALEALGFAVSEDHFMLRQQLGISVSP
jgi:tetratricopeptide (TPR) repeat protein